MGHIGGSRLRVGACLSLSGRFARFGRQAAHGLRAWQELDGNADVLIEDDASDVRTLQAILPQVAARSDLLLGPYSTVLTNAAVKMAAEASWLLWNHGGSGGDTTSQPGHVVSVLTPARRYAKPFLDHIAEDPRSSRELLIVHGAGKFSRQIADGASEYARELGIRPVRTGLADGMLTGDVPHNWTLLSAGTFEEDTRIVLRARNLPNPPRLICAVAAGVREFTEIVSEPAGIFGIAQWFPHSGQPTAIGPTEDEFLDAHLTMAGEPPGYPAVQAAAGAAIATHCARLAGSTARNPLWRCATTLDTTTLFGGFKIDPVNGTQTRHQTVLLSWTNQGLELVPSR
jgi:hypothetical protein